MKKLLALVLALVMTLGLATVGANAAVKSAKDYTDYDKIDSTTPAYEQAVAVMSNIGVFGGKDSGDFGFEDDLKRSEGATIIARMLLGPTISKQLEAQTASEIYTSDMTNHWAAGYVDYLTKAGILAGKGKDASGKDQFQPDAPLTKVEFGKMLLTALGYDQYMEGLVGADWAVNTQRLVEQNKLWANDDEPTGSMTITRQEAALHAYNALQAPMVNYDNSGHVQYVTSSARDSQTVSSATVNDGSARGTYMVEFAEHYYPELVRNTHDKDEWGRPQTTWTYNREKISQSVNTGKLVLASTESDGYVKGSEVYTALGGSSILGDNGTFGRYANNVQLYGERFLIYVDGAQVKADSDKYAAIVNLITSNGDKLKTVSGTGREFEVYLDDDSYYAQAEGVSANVRVPTVTLVTINTWLAKAAANYNTADKKMNLDVYTDALPYGERIEAKTEDLYSDSKALESYKQGDYMLVNVNRSDKDPAVKFVYDPVILDNTAITAYTTDKDTNKFDTLTTNGTKYTIATTANYDQEQLDNYTRLELNGYTYKVFLDKENSNNVMGIVKVSSSDNFVFVTGLQNDSQLLGGAAYRANVIYTNGNMTPSQVVYTANNGTARQWIAQNTNLVGRWDLNTWFTYSQSANGSITLVDVIPGAGSWTLATTGSQGYRQTAINHGTAINNYADSFQIISMTQTNNNNVVVGTARPGDDTKFVTVSLATTAGVRQIDRVNGTWTGIRGTQIIPGTTDFNAHPITGVRNANLFYIYNSNGYVLAAVAVTDRSVTRNLMYVTKSEPSGRSEYVNSRYTYLDDYKVIVSGESAIVTKGVNSGFTYTNGVKLAKDTLYDVSYDANGYVEYAQEVDLTLPQFAMTGNNGNDKYGILKVDDYRVSEIVVGGDNVISARGVRTVNGTPTTTTVGSIRTSTNGNFWVQRGATSNDYHRFATAYDAYNYARQNGWVIAEVYGLCTQVGWADTAVFRAMAPDSLDYARSVALAELDYSWVEYNTVWANENRSRLDRWGAQGVTDATDAATLYVVGRAAILASSTAVNATLARLATEYDIMCIDGKFVPTAMSLNRTPANTAAGIPNGIAIPTKWTNANNGGVVFHQTIDEFNTSMLPAGTSIVVAYRESDALTAPIANPLTYADALTGYTLWTGDAWTLLDAMTEFVTLDRGDSIRMFLLNNATGAIQPIPAGYDIMIGGTNINAATTVTGNVTAYGVTAADNGALTIDVNGTGARPITEGMLDVIISADANGTGYISAGSLDNTGIRSLTVKSGVKDYVIDGDMLDTIALDLTVEPNASLIIRNGKNITIGRNLIVKGAQAPLYAEKPGELTLTNSSSLTIMEGATIEGELVINGNVNTGINVTGPTYIRGSSMYLEDGFANFNGDVYVYGTLAIGDGDATAANANIDGVLHVYRNGTVTIKEDGSLYVSMATLSEDSDIGVTPWMQTFANNIYQIAYQDTAGGDLESLNLPSIRTDDAATLVANIVADVNAKIASRNLTATVQPITAADVAVNGNNVTVTLTKVGGGAAPTADAKNPKLSDGKTYASLAEAGIDAASVDSLTVENGTVVTIAPTDALANVTGDILVTGDGSTLNIGKDLTVGGNVTYKEATTNGEFRAPATITGNSLLGDGHVVNKGAKVNFKTINMGGQSFVNEDGEVDVEELVVNGNTTITAGKITAKKVTVTATGELYIGSNGTLEATEEAELNGNITVLGKFIIDNLKVLADAILVFQGANSKMDVSGNADIQAAPTVAGATEPLSVAGTVTVAEGAVDAVKAAADDATDAKVNAEPPVEDPELAKAKEETQDYIDETVWPQYDALSEALEAVEDTADEEKYAEAEEAVEALNDAISAYEEAVKAATTLEELQAIDSSAIDAAYAAAKAAVEAAGGKVEPTPATEATVTVTVSTELEGVSVEGITVTLTGEKAAAVTATTDAEGKAVFEKVDSSDTYTASVAAVAGSYKESSAAVAFAEDKTTGSAELKLVSETSADEFTVTWTVPTEGVKTFKVADAEGKEINSGDKVAKDTVLTVTFEAADGFAVTVKAGDTAIESGKTFTVTADTALTIDAGDANNIFTVSWKLPEQGVKSFSVKTADGTEVKSGEDKFARGTILTVSFEAETGYNVTVMAGGNKVENGKTFILTAETELQITTDKGNALAGLKILGKDVTAKAGSTATGATKAAPKEGVVSLPSNAKTVLGLSDVTANDTVKLYTNDTFLNETTSIGIDFPVTKNTTTGQDEKKGDIYLTVGNVFYKVTVNTEIEDTTVETFLGGKVETLASTANGETKTSPILLSATTSVSAETVAKVTDIVTKNKGATVELYSDSTFATKVDSVAANAGATVYLTVKDGSKLTYYKLTVAQNTGAKVGIEKVLDVTNKKDGTGSTATNPMIVVVEKTSPAPTEVKKAQIVAQFSGATVKFYGKDSTFATEVDSVALDTSKKIDTVYATISDGGVTAYYRIDIQLQSNAGAGDNVVIQDSKVYGEHYLTTDTSGGVTGLYRTSDSKRVTQIGSVTVKSSGSSDNGTTTYYELDMSNWLAASSSDTPTGLSSDGSSQVLTINGDVTIDSLSSVALVAGTGGLTDIKINGNLIVNGKLDIANVKVTVAKDATISATGHVDVGDETVKTTSGKTIASGSAGLDVKGTLTVNGNSIRLVKGWMKLVKAIVNGGFTVESGGGALEVTNTFSIQSKGTVALNGAKATFKDVTSAVGSTLTVGSNGADFSNLTTQGTFTANGAVNATNADFEGTTNIKANVDVSGKLTVGTTSNVTIDSGKLLSAKVAEIDKAITAPAETLKVTDSLVVSDSTVMTSVTNAKTIDSKTPTLAAAVGTMTITVTSLPTDTYTKNTTKTSFTATGLTVQMSTTDAAGAAVKILAEPNGNTYDVTYNVGYSGATYYWVFTPGDFSNKQVGDAVEVNFELTRTAGTDVKKGTGKFTVTVSAAPVTDTETGGNTTGTSIDQEGGK